VSAGVFSTAEPLKMDIGPGLQDQEVRNIHYGPERAVGEIGDTLKWSCSDVILCCGIVADTHGMSDAIRKHYQFQHELKALRIEQGE
jgi:hypothetical protein